MKENLYFQKKSFRTPQTRQNEIAQKKLPVGRIIPPFFSESSESDRVFNYLHDSNSIFRAAGIKSETFHAARYSVGTPNWAFPGKAGKSL